jgi:DNA-binding LytR/AlgR family response regulator
MTRFSLSAAVVDDDPLQVEILRGIAEAANIKHRVRFTGFRSLKGLMSRAGRSTFGVVFLDRRLPDSDGFEYALATLAQARLSSPLVLMSAYAGKQTLNAFGLIVYGPMDKVELAQPAYFKRLIDVIAPASRSEYG